MTSPARQYLAVCIVGVVATLCALGLLLVARLVQPGSPIVDRGLVPRPLRWLTARAQGASLRVWCFDADLAEQLAKHWSGPDAAKLDRLGAAPVDAPELADVVVVTGADPAPPVLAAVPVPHTIVVIDDLSDVGAVVATLTEVATARRSVGAAAPAGTGAS